MGKFQNKFISVWFAFVDVSKQCNSLDRNEVSTNMSHCMRHQEHTRDIYIYQRRSQEFFFGGGFQQIQLRTEDREDGDLGVVASYSGVLEAAVIWYKKFHFIW